MPPRSPPHRQGSRRALPGPDERIRARRTTRASTPPATPAQKATLQKLSPEAVTASTLAGEPITAKLTRAPGNDAPIGGLKVVARERLVRRPAVRHGEHLQDLCGELPKRRPSRRDSSRRADNGRRRTHVNPGRGGSSGCCCWTRTGFGNQPQASQASSMKTRFTRRDFLKASAVAAGATVFGDSAATVLGKLGPPLPPGVSLRGDRSRRRGIHSTQNYRAPEWFRDAKFGIWAHWRPQCVPEQGDWYARQMYQPGRRASTTTTSQTLRPPVEVRLHGDRPPLEGRARGSPRS